MGSDESHVAAIPKQYVVDSMMDVTKIFNGKTRVSLAGGPIFKCCKSRPNDLGLLVDEADEKTHELLQGCRGLVGIRFKSFTRYEEHPENARCLVAKSGMPDAFLQHLYHFPAEVVPVVGELVDVSDVLMKQEKSVTLPSGRTYRCCMKAGDRHAFLVEQRNNALDGTVFQRLQENFAPLSNKKCSGLVAVGYSSWKKWAGNRCIVQSSHIPQEAMKLLGWTLLATISKESPIPEADGPVNTEELRTSTPKPKRQLTNQISTITDEIEEFDVPAVANGDNVNDVALQGLCVEHIAPRCSAAFVSWIVLLILLLRTMTTMTMRTRSWIVLLLLRTMTTTTMRSSKHLRKQGHRRHHLHNRPHRCRRQHRHLPPTGNSLCAW